MNQGCGYGLTSPPARGARFRGFILGLCALLSLNALAIETSLQPEEIEEAYSLGQTSNHEELADFLKQYQHDFRYPSDNPVAYVQSIEFQTPYEQIVLRTLRTTQYTRFRAEEDYRANSRLIIVRIVTAIRINYSGPVPPADKYLALVSQAKPIEPRKVTNTVTCDPFNQTAYPVPTDCSIYTREILLNFDARQFEPGPVTVKVELPFQQSMETQYDLDKLK
jgi:hypothetical protein